MLWYDISLQYTNLYVDSFIHMGGLDIDISEYDSLNYLHSE